MQLEILSLNSWKNIFCKKKEKTLIKLFSSHNLFFGFV